MKWDRRRNESSYGDPILIIILVAFVLIILTRVTNDAFRVYYC